jgi:branched-chain amino acid transport system substrate-binding protein
MARFAKEKLHLSRVATFYDMSDAYSSGLNQEFIRNARAQGITITGTESYRSEETHFSAQLSALLETRPAALYIPGAYGQVALIAREARAAGFAGMFLGGDAWSSQTLLDMDDNALAGRAYFTSAFSAENTFTPESRAFINSFRQRHGRLPDEAAALGFDAMKVALFAVQQSINRTFIDGESLFRRFTPWYTWSPRTELRIDDLRTNVAETLRSLRNFRGATGTITMDANRNAVKTVLIQKVLANEFQLDPRSFD